MEKADLLKMEACFFRALYGKNVIVCQPPGNDIRMDSKIFEQIILGPRQVLLFDLEDETVADQQRVETCLSDHIRISGLVDVEAFVHSAAPYLGLSEFQVLQNLFWLAHDKKIHFRAAGEKIAPNVARKLLTESLEPRLQLALGRQVDGTVFCKAQDTYRQLTHAGSSVADLDQFQFAHRLALQIRAWKSTLEKYQKKSRQPGFPGIDDIKAGLDLLRTVAVDLDAHCLIQAFVQYAEKLDRLTRTISTLSDFFGSQSQRWRRMVQFHQAAEPTLTGSIEDPGIAEPYARFRSILSSPQPYDAVEEAWQLYQSVNEYYEKIVAQQTRQCRKAALAEVDTLIRNMKNQLDQHDAEDDVRNQALYVLRSMAKSIQMANGIKQIHRFAEAAHEAFEVWLDTLAGA